MADTAYLGLAALAVLGLAVAVVVCTRGLRVVGPRRGVMLRGVTAAASGMALALVGGVLARAVLDRSPYYQQVRFVVFYAGFAAIVLGLATVLRVTDGVRRREQPDRVVRAFVGIFAVSVAVGLVLVFAPGTHVLNRYGDQVQLPVYFTPMIVASAGGVLLFLGRAGTRRRRPSRWVGLFALGLLVGVLQESGLVPTPGDPLAGILGIFLPFAAAAWCLAVAASTAYRDAARSQSAETTLTTP